MKKGFDELLDEISEENGVCFGREPWSDWEAVKDAIKGAISTKLGFGLTERCPKCGWTTDNNDYHREAEAGNDET